MSTAAAETTAFLTFGQPGEAPTVVASADTVVASDENDVWKVESVSLTRNGKATNIEVQLAGPHPLSDAALRALELEYDGRGTHSGRMVCLRGTEFEGIWTPTTIRRNMESGGSIMSCWGNYDSTAGWKPLTWGLRPHEAGSNVCIFDKAEEAGREAPAAQDDTASLRVATNLVLHARATVLWVHAIDTVGQSVKANVYYELRARGIFERCINSEQQAEFLQVYGMSVEQHPATLSNAVEEISQETWTTVSASRMEGKASLLDVCWKRRTTAFFSQSMELHEFPFDVQELQVMLF